MLRARESPDLRLICSELVVTPPAVLTLAHDVFGNTVATARFQSPSDTLRIHSCTDVRLSAALWPVFDVAASAISYPFRYADDERTNLGALAVQQYADSAGLLSTWARGFVRSNPTDTLSLLKDLGNGIATWVSYEGREDEGTQTPIETLHRKRGSCRDFAVLFVEATRSLGFGARIVSGYLLNSSGALVGTSGAGSTHAWAEVFVPGAGWITFDPTNRSFGGANLVPVAVARDIFQVAPVTGSFVGPAGAFVDLIVDVKVAELSDAPVTQEPIAELESFRS